MSDIVHGPLVDILIIIILNLDYLIRIYFPTSVFFKAQIIHKMTGEHESEKIILLELCSLSSFLHKQWYPTVNE